MWTTGRYNSITLAGVCVVCNLCEKHGEIERHRNNVDVNTVIAGDLGKIAKQTPNIEEEIECFF